MFPFNHPENIRKPKNSYPLIRTHTSVYQGVSNFTFFDVFKGITWKHKEEKG